MLCRMKTEARKTRAHILARINAFLKATGMSEHEFGIQAVSNHHFLRRLRDSDVGVTLTNIEKAEAFMRKFPTSDSEAA